MSGRKKGLFARPALLLIATLLFAVHLSPGASSANESPAMTVETTGQAAIIDSNTVVARDSAIADALRKAVEQAIGAFVSSDTMVESFEVLRDSIYTRTEGYVKSYAITGESLSDGIYTVKVRAVVASGEVEDELDALGLIQRKAERPRVLFMMTERRVGKDSHSSWRAEAGEGAYSQAALEESFLAKGFSVVAASREDADGFPSYGSEGFTVDVARDKAKKAGAAIVVLGKALVRESPASGTAVTIYLADVSAEAIRVDDGSVLASAMGQGTARNISSSTGSAEALSKASRDLSDGLVRQITAKWAGVDLVIVTLKGAPYDKAVEFKRLLRSRIQGVEAVYQRRFEGSDASFEVESKLTAAAIADEISRQGYKVTGATGNTIEVEAGN